MNLELMNLIPNSINYFIIDFKSIIMTCRIIFHFYYMCYKKIQIFKNKLDNKNKLQY